MEKEIFEENIVDTSPVEDRHEDDGIEIVDEAEPSIQEGDEPVEVESEQEMSEGGEAHAFDEEEEAREKPKKRDKAKTRINQIQREKYRALHELDQMRNENEQLRKMVDLSSQSALKQYEDGVIRRLERARQLKTQAIESGDVQSQVDADMELSMSTNEMQTLNNWKAQQEVQRNYTPQNYQEPSYVSNAPVLNEWVNRNAWFHPESDSFDEELSENIHQYSLELNEALTRAGRPDQIMTPQYFAEIDKQVQGFVNYRNSQNPQRRDLNMKSVKGGASPSRGGYSNAPAPKQYTITSSEKDMARRMGISDKDYIKYREMDQRSRGGR